MRIESQLQPGEEILYRALTVEDRLARLGRALFFKVSYAFQH